MASDYIMIGGNADRNADELRRVVFKLTEAVDAYNSFVRKAAHASSGSDWAGFAAFLNIADQAQAQAIYNLMAGVNSSVNSAAMEQLLGRLG